MEPNKEGYGVQDSILKSDGSGGEFLYIKKPGGSVKPALIRRLIIKNILCFKMVNLCSKAW